MGCKSPTLKNKKKKKEREGKMREIFSLDLERNPLKSDRIFVNDDWLVMVTTNEWEGVAGS